MDETTTLTSKGQVTIPKDVRKRLGFRAGDRLKVVERDGSCMLTKLPPTESVFAQWRGYAKDLEGVDVDALVDDMRGR